MRQEGCPDCDRLWASYEQAVMSHTRLQSKAKLARLRYEQEMAKLDAQVLAAAEERKRLRHEIMEHERQAHTATKPSFSE